MRDCGRTPEQEREAILVRLRHRPTVCCVRPPSIDAALELQRGGLVTCREGDGAWRGVLLVERVRSSERPFGKPGGSAA